MGSERNTTRSRVERWIALGLCIAVATAASLEQLAGSRAAYAAVFAPQWVPIAGAVLGAVGLAWSDVRTWWARASRTLLWSGLLLMVWAGGGLPIDLLRLTPLMPPGVDWPGMATRTLALAAVVALARLVLARPSASVMGPANWYGLAAFALALPYPVFRTVWALGGTIGLMWPGAAGQGFVPWLASIPWQIAAALSLLLVPVWRRAPRRLLLAAGWSATAIVAMFGPAAFLSVITKVVAGRDLGLTGIHSWVAVLFYGSWFLWAVAAAAATRSYQLRSAAFADPVT